MPENLVKTAELKLQILIPTYKRVIYLQKNLKLLGESIRACGACDRIGIVISDNASKDGTVNAVKQFIAQNPDIDVQFSGQPMNVGLEENALQVLEKATADYVMFLGDDDYISTFYMMEVDQAINARTVACIVPAYKAIDIHGRSRNPATGRDLGKPTRLYPAGRRTAARFLRRGHQLSGVTFMREGTLHAYQSLCPSNIYLFMYFVGYNALRGNLLHLTKHPVEVTEPDQSAKDWNYGEDGLVCERFKNTHGLFANSAWRYVAEFSLIRYRNRRFSLKYARLGLVPLSKFVLHVLTCRHFTYFGKAVFLVITMVDVLKFYLRKLGVFRAVRSILSFIRKLLRES